MKWVVLTWKTNIDEISVAYDDNRETALFDSDGEARAWAYSENYNNVVIVRVL